ncbi:MAG: enoyl-CoA hydratase [Trueperaceae bacterium]|nr:MAG: enoyl-CoA hydratase [Trueperaceae bacterium]
MSEHIDDADQAEGIEFEHLSIAVDGHVAIVTIEREDALNALNAELLLELATAFDLIEGDADVRALVITGAGRAFVAGADLQAFADVRDGFAGREAALTGQDVMNTLAALPIPTVAAINGFALGGGLELALACDLRVAAAGAKLGLPEVTRGLIPGYGGTQRLQRLIGLARATDLVLTGRMVAADEALALGLVSRVADDAAEAALALAQQCARNAPVALGLAKEALMRGVDVTLPQGLEIEADLFGLAVTTDDAKEGIASFFEKRDPDYRGS